MSRRELLLGCGSQRHKLFDPDIHYLGWHNLETVDINKNHKPTYCFDLDNVKWPLNTDWYDEIHAYEVLEHLGRQGDVLSFFATFKEIWRLLKPNGYLCATVPSRYSEWLWADPGHCRAILPATLGFLDQTTYQQVGHTTLSDYRDIWKADFKIYCTDDDRKTHSFTLQAIKPSRYYVKN